MMSEGASEAWERIRRDKDRIENPFLWIVEYNWYMRSTSFKASLASVVCSSSRSSCAPLLRLSWVTIMLTASDEVGEGEVIGIPRELGSDVDSWIVVSRSDEGE